MLVETPVISTVVSVDLTLDGQWQDTLVASAHAPSVTILSPAPGETLNAGSEVEWEWSDQDGDELMASVSFSHNGVTRRTIANNATGNVIPVPVDSLPGTAAGSMFVAVSDGFHTTVAEVNGLIVGTDAPPDVHISSPVTGRQIRSTSGVVLLGWAFDREDGPVPGNSMLWSSSISGPIAVGPAVKVDLPIGVHVLTLTTTDTAGHTTQATTTIVVN
jgi:hypothetical protein